VEAVCFALVVIGEAVTHVPESVQTDAPQIPWRKMKGMRNIAAHEYFGLDLSTVWQTATSTFPRSSRFSRRCSGVRPASMGSAPSAPHSIGTLAPVAKAAARAGSARKTPVIPDTSRQRASSPRRASTSASAPRAPS
jgi:Protein of unknown function DUF86